jgi:hypothetical protein
MHTPLKFVTVKTEETNMSNRDLPTTKLVAMYLVAIGASGFPNSYVWMHVDPNMEDLDYHLAVISALKQQDIVKESNDFLTLTDKGLRMLSKVLEVISPTLSQPSTPPSHESRG